MSRPTPRRPASSRGAVNRPRRIAGRSTAPVGGPARPEDGADVDGRVEPVGTLGAEDAPDDTTDSADSGNSADTTDAEARGVQVGSPGQERDDDRREPAPVLASPGATRMLVRILAVLAVLLLLQAVWWVRHTWFVDEPAEPSRATGAIGVPADRPVVENELAWKEGVDVAAQAVQAIMTRSHESYDADVEAAAAFLTDDFAEEFRTTTDDVKESFLAKKAVMDAEVRAQSVVRANDAELQALIFFNQSTVTTGGKDPKTVRSAYRALVTLVHTDKGWFVDRLDAR